MVIVKLGEQGALAVTADGATHAPAVPLPRIVDPVGAGDAFLAGFLAGQLRGHDLEGSLALGNRSAAHIMMVANDQEGLPRWDEVAGPAFGGDVRR
jgi:sugar/nucleoside kinase (ribokinase family)